MHVILLCRRTPSFLADAEILSGEVSWGLQVSAFRMAWNSHLLFNSEVTRTMEFGEESSYFYSDSASSTSYSEKHHKVSEIMLCELGSEKNDTTSWAAVRVKCKLCVEPLSKRQRVLWGCASSSLSFFVSRWSSSSFSICSQQVQLRHQSKMSDERDGVNKYEKGVCLCDCIRMKKLYLNESHHRIMWITPSYLLYPILGGPILINDSVWT